MARIVISLSGEGRGHAARTLSLLEMLAEDHHCLVLAPRNVYDLIRGATRRCLNVQLSQLPSLHFKYNRRGNLCYARSWFHAIPFIANLTTHLTATRSKVESFGADLAITDFEPLLPRVARKLEIPLLSLDHQHFLYLLDTASLSLQLRAQVRFLRPSIKLFCPHADRHLVSSFCCYPQITGTKRHYEQVGVLIRREFADLTSENGEYLLVYVRRPANASWLEELRKCGIPCKVYGFAGSGTHQNIEFCPIDAHKFMLDLAGCRALLTTAGNQLVGEALVAGKPILAVPEPGNFEQQINGHFLAQNGLGQTINQRDCNAESIHAFLAQADQYREAVADYECDGNRRVLDVIQGMLQSPNDDVAPVTAQMPDREVA